MARVGRDESPISDFIDQEWTAPPPDPIGGLYHPLHQHPAILDMQPVEAMRGHPTAAGFPDQDRSSWERFGAQEGARGGLPGQPHVHPSPFGHGPGLPGPTPTGPLQPGAVYNKGADTGH